MSLGEFDLIRRYFKAAENKRRDVLIGVGDDAAVMSIPDGQQLVVTVDTLLETVHFLPEVSPGDLAHKALSVNLSDLAAMGAEPAWITLSLTVPEINEEWLSAFSQQLKAQCDFYHVQLVGGDTCKGPLSITIQAMGHAPKESIIQRNNAQIGDLVYVTGTLGDAAAGLALLQGNAYQSNQAHDFLVDRLNKPQPRLEAGMLLRQLANAAIDISDGLIQDLTHILEASDVGAVVEINNLPLSEAIIESCSEKQARSFAMTGGDDYELCFTIAPDQQAKLEQVFISSHIPITQIGRITSSKGLQLRNKAQEVAIQNSGFDHFQSEKTHEQSH